MITRTAIIDFEKINLLVADKLLSYGELAKLAGLSINTVFAIKSGRRNASFRTIRKLAAALNVQPGDIIKQ